MESKHPITPEDLINAPTIADPQVSADGAAVAFVVGQASREGEHDTSAIWLLRVAGEEPARRFTSGVAHDTKPRWSPDGRWLAFLSDRAERGTLQPYLICSEGGEAERLAEIKGKVEDLQWSPDGAMLALHVTESETEEQAKRKKERDDATAFGDDWKTAHLWTLRLADRRLTQLTSHRRHLTEMAWGPDSSRIAALSVESPWADAWYSPALLELYPAEGGTGQKLGDVPGHYASLRWSPDGGTLAMLGSEGRVSDALTLYAMPATGGTPRLLRPGYQGAVEWYAWLPDSSALLVGAVEDLTSTLYTLPLDTTAPPEALLPEELRDRGYFANNVSCSADGRIVAFVRSTGDEPAELWAGPVEAPRKRTAINAAAAGWAIGRAEHLHWRGADDLPISGLLIYPAEYQPGKRYPLVLEIHGGPAWLWSDRFLADWHDWAQYLASHGYAVLLPNPRGSTGRGATFTEGNVDDYGGKELEDSLRGVDQVIAMGVADPERLGIGGWSHGGYMTAWAVTQTTRFKAAVMGAGMANLLSDQGQNDIPRMNDDYFTARAYDDPDAYLRRSPIAFVKRVVTPTLVLHGESDARVHPAQGREFFMALRLHGVPTDYVMYPREEHPIKERAHQRDLLRRVLAWFDRYLKDTGTA